MKRLRRFIHVANESSDTNLPGVVVFVLLVTAVFAAVGWYIAAIWYLLVSFKLGLAMTFGPPILFVAISYLLWEDKGE